VQKKVPKSLSHCVDALSSLELIAIRTGAKSKGADVLMKPGRNDPCPCGSGKKFKKCCEEERRPASAMQSHASQVSPSASEQTARWVRLFNAGRYVELELAARETIAREPGSGLAWKALGLALLARGHDGVSALEKAADLLPADAETQINLGTALHASGKLEEAAASYRRALIVDPGRAEAHNNLANVLRDLGRFEEAAASCRRALDIRPDFAAAHCNLGVVSRALGQIEEAVASHRRAIALQGNLIEAHVNLGNALVQLGHLDEAVAAYRRALEIRPDLALVHFSLGAALCSLGQEEEGAASYRHAILYKPEFAEAFCKLGNALRSLGKQHEATASYRRAVELRPDYSEAQNNLGTVLHDLGQTEEAIACYRRVVEREPDLAEVHGNLGNAFRDLGRLDEAVASHRKSLELNPNLSAAYNNLAIALAQRGQGVEAEGMCRAALERFPNAGATLALLAKLRADRGEFAEAESLYRRSISVDPDSAEAWAGIAALKKFTDRDASWLAAAKRLADRSLEPRQEAQLRFAIGKYFDDTGEFGQAFDSYRRANELAKLCVPRFDREQLASRVRATSRASDRAWTMQQRTAALSSTRPIFVVGMPRSGTSLAEQILASHPKIHGAGELPFWDLASSSLAASQDEGASNTALANVGEDYLELLQRLSADALRVVDKMPGNFWNLGLIHAVFPNARIIHMSRDPIDTCLSIYFQDLWGAHSYANDLEDLACYYRGYRLVMQHWHATLPRDAILDVPYEALIEEQERWSRKMLEFVELPWDAACIDFHRSDRRVATASKWQVRQPIYKSSAGRWRNYERFIGPLLSLSEADIPAYVDDRG
jgi:tetratricopeptide (TPR) repeat protein